MAMLMGAASMLGGGGGGLSSSSSAASESGDAGSGKNVITVGGTPPNLEAIINAVQGGGSSRVGGTSIQQRSFLGPLSSGGVNIDLPGLGGVSLSPLLIIAGAAGVLILPRLLKRK